MQAGRGRYPMDRQQSASDSSTPPLPTLPRRVPADGRLGRLAPDTAPQRDAIDDFCRASRPWALRQAKRTYRHLPVALREQAVDRAYNELRTRTPGSTERRVLDRELADRLTESLRHVHVGWCLHESGALLGREGVEPAEPEVRRDGLAAFIDGGLGGLERAILQLEIGAGRDTRTSRAALRLHPRAYTQQREAGFSKLRDAISAQVIGRACAQHVAGVVDAAMGNRTAMEELATGGRRCRSCAREAHGLRSVLHERLAVAPWPLVIKPAGLLAAKAGALGAIFGGKSAGVGGAGALVASSGGGAGSLAAGVLAITALATGTAAVVGGDAATPRERAAGHTPAARTSAPATTKTSRTTAKPVATTERRGSTRARVRPVRQNRGSGTPAPVATAPATASAGATAAPAQPASEPSQSRGAVGTVTKPVTDAVDATVKPVTDSLPEPVASPVQGLVDDATKAVGDTTKAVDTLLNP